MKFAFVLRFSHLLMLPEVSLDYTVGDLRKFITKTLTDKEAPFTMNFQGNEMEDDGMLLYPFLRLENGGLLKIVDVKVHDRPIVVPVAEESPQGNDIDGGVAAVATEPQSVAVDAIKSTISLDNYSSSSSDEDE